MYLAERKLSQAEDSAEQCIRILSRTGHGNDISAALAYSVLGSVYSVNDDTRAEETLRSALDIPEKRLPPQDYLRGEGLASLGLFYVQRGALEKGEPLLEKAHASFRANAKLNL